MDGGSLAPTEATVLLQLLGVKVVQHFSVESVWYILGARTACMATFFGGPKCNPDRYLDLLGKGT